MQPTNNDYYHLLCIAMSIKFIILSLWVDCKVSRQSPPPREQQEEVKCLGVPLRLLQGHLSANNHGAIPSFFRPLSRTSLFSFIPLSSSLSPYPSPGSSLPSHSIPSWAKRPFLPAGEAGERCQLPSGVCGRPTSTLVYFGRKKTSILVVDQDNFRENDRHTIK